MISTRAHIAKFQVRTLQQSGQSGIRSGDGVWPSTLCCISSFHSTVQESYCAWQSHLSHGDPFLWRGACAAKAPVGRASGSIWHWRDKSACALPRNRRHLGNDCRRVATVSRQSALRRRRRALHCRGRPCRREKSLNSAPNEDAVLPRYPPPAAPSSAWAEYANEREDEQETKSAAAVAVANFT